MTEPLPRLWSQPLPAPARGLSPAREAGLLLARCEEHGLFLFAARGVPQARARLEGRITAAAAADDGSAFAAASDSGKWWWLAPDLTPRWERELLAKATALAVEPLGRYLAAADAKGRLHLVNADGTTVRKEQCPRPLQHLAFAPAAALLLAAADFGFVGAMDLRTGEWRWRDSPMAHAGSLAVGEDGEPAVVACFSDGLRRYRRDGTALPPVVLPQPCAAAALTFDGARAVAAGTGGGLYGVGPDGQIVFSKTIDAAPAAL